MASRFAILGFAGAALLAATAYAQNNVVLPEGAGREIVAERCGICHVLRFARSTDYSTEGWRVLVQQMRNIGLPLSDAEYETVTRYLTTVNPERPRAPARLIPGPVKVEIKEYPVAMAGALPRDAAVAADGTLWFTGQFGGLLIHFDPKSGALREHRVRIPYSGPMGIAIDSAGDIWFAANRGGYIGRMNPRDGKFTEYRMPADGPADPAEIVIDARGIVWFTLQNGDSVGRLDPTSGALSFIPLAKDSTPFALELDSKGALYVGLRDGHAIMRIDANTLEKREYKLANTETEPRRIAIAANDIVWYTDIDRGFIGRLDPASGVVKEYASPSGPISAPHAIAAIGDVIWYVETETVPNTLVRFDPNIERFQSWPVPSGYAQIRDLAVTPEGDIAFATGTTNRIGIADITE